MRGEIGMNVERALAGLWDRAATTVPDWLPMRYVDWLATAYDVAARFQPEGRGRSNLYLVLLDYRDSRAEPYGVYVGMSQYTAAERFDQHKAGIRAAGSVLKRGLEVLTGPVPFWGPRSTGCVDSAPCSRRGVHRGRRRGPC